MKVFLSQPMRGKTPDEIKEVRIKMVELCEAQGFEIADSLLNIEGMKPIECFANSVKVLSECDAIMMAPSWWDARGCRLELNIAKEYGLWTLNLEDNIDFLKEFGVKEETTHVKG